MLEDGTNVLCENRKRVGWHVREASRYSCFASGHERCFNEEELRRWMS